MKRMISFFVLIVSAFSVGGCGKEKVQTDISNVEYLEGTSKESIAHNLRLVANAIKSVEFIGKLNIDGKDYIFNGKLIIKDTIENSLLYIEFDNNHLYLKNGKIYLSYFYNNTNVIVKDNIENYIREIDSILLTKGISFNEENVINFIKNKTIKDIDFNVISKYVSKVNDGYEINHNNLKMKFDNDYLLEQLSFDKNNVSFALNFKYSNVKINIPLGYDIFNINIESIKKLLKVDNLSELIK